jgi:hypothetical protein
MPLHLNALGVMAAGIPYLRIMLYRRTGGGGGGRVGSGKGSGGGGGSGGLGGGSGGSGGSGGLGSGSSRQDAGSVGTGAAARYVPQSSTGPARTATA